MKKVFIGIAIIVLVVSSIFSLTACKQKAENETLTATTTTTEAVTITTPANTKKIKAVQIYDGEEGKVSINVDKIKLDKVEVSIDVESEKGNLYVALWGDVENHSLEGDGSMNDGLAIINDDGIAEFSVTWDDGQTVQFIVRIV